jgi:hypothetical protein
MVVFHVLAQRDRGQGGAGAQEVVSAGVSGCAGDEGLALWHGVLGETGQRVEFSQNGDDGTRPAP